uniref:Secreted phosphoprotein 24 n=1 Tax=Oncorhynchus mykiss TaxID=8022 RepID=A0A8C7P092_ONCMY
MLHFAFYIFVPHTLTSLSSLPVPSRVDFSLNGLTGTISILTMLQIKLANLCSLGEDSSKHTEVVPLGLNTYDLMMNFGIKETDCLKSSGEDPQRCAFRVGFFVPAASCTARVRVTAELTQVVSLNCGQDSSSSESSSEENFTRKRQQLNVQPSGNRGPVLPGFSEATLFPSHSFSRQVEPQPIPRGDSIGNHLE